MASRALFVAFVALASSIGINAQTNAGFCGGAGYDVTASARDMSFVQGQWTYWVHPCGAVSASSDASCASPAEAPFGSMFCQRRNTNQDTFVLANYNETVARNQAKWYAVPNGVAMEVSNGEVCGAVGGFFRSATIEFRCDPSATTSQLIEVSEPETCWYKAVVATSSACSNIGATISNVVGSSFYSMQCGGGIFDFTSLRESDMHYDGPGFDYWLRMCGYVTAPQCAAVQPTSFCQKFDGNNNSAPIDISDWNFANAQLYTITPTGVDVVMREGDACGGQPRRATYSLQCNSRARRPWISFVAEYQTCHYKAVIQTSAVCTGTNNPVRGYCGGAGYDLSGLQGADLTLFDNDYEWTLHPCGIISPWYTGHCLDQQSMFCQSRRDGAGDYSLATWNRNVSGQATWVALENGVQLYVANSGGSCGGVIRDATINFICNRTAISPWFAKVSEPAMCWYVAEVHTEFACDSVSATAEMIPGSTFWSNQCGGGYMDVSDIRDENGDLGYDANPATPGSGHRFYLELCGQVNDPACASVQPTQFCQVDKNTSTAYSLARWEQDSVEKYTINENGFTMLLSNGSPCGGLGNRTTQIQVVCDGSRPAYVSSLREIETCHYVAVVHGRCQRGSTEPFSTGPAQSSSSSKLSGGAIAGIVIGSIVGALILLAILFVFCCSAGMSGLRKQKGTRRFDEEESTNQQSEMEMEGSTA